MSVSESIAAVRDLMETKFSAELKDNEVNRYIGRGRASQNYTSFFCINAQQSMIGQFKF